MGFFRRVAGKFLRVGSGKFARRGDCCCGPDACDVSNCGYYDAFYYDPVYTYGPAIDDPGTWVYNGTVEGTIVVEKLVQALGEDGNLAAATIRFPGTVDGSLLGLCGVGGETMLYDPACGDRGPQVGPPPLYGSRHECYRSRGYHFENPQNITDRDGIALCALFQDDLTMYVADANGCTLVINDFRQACFRTPTTVGNAGATGTFPCCVPAFTGHAHLTYMPQISSTSFGWQMVLRIKAGPFDYFVRYRAINAFSWIADATTPHFRLSGTWTLQKVEETFVEGPEPPCVFPQLAVLNVFPPIKSGATCYSTKCGFAPCTSDADCFALGCICVNGHCFDSNQAPPLGCFTLEVPCNYDIDCGGWGTHLSWDLACGCNQGTDSPTGSLPPFGYTGYCQTISSFYEVCGTDLVTDQGDTCDMSPCLQIIGSDRGVFSVFGTTGNPKRCPYACPCLALTNLSRIVGNSSSCDPENEFIMFGPDCIGPFL